MSSSTSALTSNSAATAASAASTAPVSSTASLANQNIFLQLLVAQLKNQDPENPADGTAFITQLATFSELSNTTQMAADISTIKGDLASVPATTPATTGATSGTSGTTPTGTTNTQSTAL